MTRVSSKVEGASQVAPWQGVHLRVQESWAPSLGQEDPLEKEMVTHSRILVWRIPQTEEPGGLQFRESQRVERDQAHTRKSKRAF